MRGLYVIFLFSTPDMMRHGLKILMITEDRLLEPACETMCALKAIKPANIIKNKTSICPAMIPAFISITCFLS